MPNLGGQISKRILHFIYILDLSGSMQGEKIGALNFAINEALPLLKDVAGENPEATVLIRVLAFSSGARWILATPTIAEDFHWTNLQADNGVTDLGAALSLLAQEMKMPPMPERGLPPVLVLVSDGMPTDEYRKALRELMAEPWGKRAVRLAIGVGDDVEFEALQDFIGNNEIKPLHAQTPKQLIGYIRWASTTALKAASEPPSGVVSGHSGNVPLPPAPSITPDDDVF